MNRSMTLKMKKTRLEKEINLLKQLKNDANNKLENLSKINENDINNYSFATSNSQDDTTSLLRIKSELLKLGGQRCVKIIKDNLIFEFTVKGNDNKQMDYFVELLNFRRDVRLGKWNFPMFLDVNDILKQTPLVDVDAFSTFYRKCKYYIDCYHQRINQFTKCQNSINKYSNCIIERDQGSRYFIIQLFQVYNVKMNNYINIIVYLQYNLEETRPSKIQVESQYSSINPLTPETEKDLKSFLKPFKQYDLTQALETVEYKENARFSWQRTAKDTTLADDMDSGDVSPQKKRRTLKYSKDKTKKSKKSVPRTIDQSKRNQADITRYFKKSEITDATKQKDLENSTNEQSEQQIVRRKSSPEKKMETRLKRLKKDLKNTKTRKNQPQGQEINEPNEKRILRSSSNSPTKNANQKKTSPEIVGLFLRSSPTNDSSPQKNSPKKAEISSRLSSSPIKSPNEKSPKNLKKVSRSSSSSLNSPKGNSPKKAELFLRSSSKKDTNPKKISPKKIGIPLRSSPRKVTNSKIPVSKKIGTIKKPVNRGKKLEDIKKLISPKTVVSSATSNVKFKQTSLRIPKPNTSVSTPKKTGINLNSTKTVSVSKVVTSTPHPGKVKHVQSLSNINVSEIKKTQTNRVTKTSVKRTVNKLKLKEK